MPGLLTRYLFMGGLISLAVAVCAVVGATILQPYCMGASQGKEISGLSGQLQQLKSENSLLIQRRDSLSRPEGIEVAARSAGYLRKGEVRLVLEADPTPLPDRSESNSIAGKIRSAWMSIFAR